MPVLIDEESVLSVREVAVMLASLPEDMQDLPFAIDDDCVWCLMPAHLKLVKRNVDKHFYTVYAYDDQSNVAHTLVTPED